MTVSREVLASLSVRTLPVPEISPGLRAGMHALFARYYDDVDLALFEGDLSGKDFVLLLEDEGRLAGFTSARLFDFDWRGESIAVLFSGDTVVDRAYWGEQALARAWLGEVGRMARQLAGRRLVWFLIVKGHRTFRYLPVFARSFVPSPDGGAPEEIAGLRDALAQAMFGAAFDPVRGVIRFDRPCGRLRGQWAEPEPRERRLGDVAWFLAANPGFRDGDELACLCELSRGNMRPRAQKWFDAGWIGTGCSGG